MEHHTINLEVALQAAALLFLLPVVRDFYEEVTELEAFKELGTAGRSVAGLGPVIAYLAFGL